MLLLARCRLGWAANRVLARAGSLLLLSLDQLLPLLFFLHHPLQTFFHLCGQMQHMPDIPLVRALGFGVAQDLSNGSTAITDRSSKDRPLVVKVARRLASYIALSHDSTDRSP